MKVLFFLNAYEEDGPGILISRIASRMRSMEGISLHTAALSRGGSLEKRFHENGIPTKLIAMRGMLDFPRYNELKRFLREGAFDIIHTNILRADLIGRSAAHAAGIPFIISTEHGIHAWEHKGRLVRKLVKRYYLHTVKFTSSIIAVSDFVKKSLIAEGIPEEKVVRIYNGVDTDYFVPLKDDEKNALRRYITDEPVDSAIGLVGNLIEMKGLRYFIQALPQIFQNHPRTLVVVVGEGPLRNEMEREIALQNLSRKVKFVGKFTQITQRIVAAMDILIQPSLTESFGLTAAEALSCGVPVVASSVGGLPELIQDEVCGNLVPPKDSEILAAKVISLMDDPEKCRRFGKAGRERALKLFDLSDTVDKYLELYSRFMQKETV
ncbi:glycosyltransferase family 4 protein [Candidatus Sumerlaeota bacterium]|nr:glycosyltransferase family 4 protein [Candidatus Sumerlaeota bacterium]